MSLQRIPAVLLLLTAACQPADVCDAAERSQEAQVVEQLVLYPGERLGLRSSVWSMKSQVRDGYLVLNVDCRAKPWAGVAFRPRTRGKTLLTLGSDWIAYGFVRLEINGLEDGYGQPGPLCRLQMNLEGCQTKYKHIPATFYSGGAGVDADVQSWQQVLVPLSFLGAKLDERLTAVSLQCVGKPERAFAIKELALVRFDRLPGGRQDALQAKVAQPEVTWPGYDELPDSLKVNGNKPMLREGMFVTADGRRTFLIMPWSQENQRLNLGVNREGKVCPSHDLYDKDSQAFIYEQPLQTQSMSRLGFNCFAGSVAPEPFWDAVGYKSKGYRGFTHQDFLAHVSGIRYPFYVDMVCFPWALGKPGEDAQTNLAPAARHNGNRHWAPYRIVGQGRQTWLTLWTTYARRYREAGADVLFYELMNEPAYVATTPDHRQQFIDWLQARYQTLAKVNRTWDTEYPSWDAVRDFKKSDECTGIFFDYDEYLGDCFTDLVTEGSAALEQITPGIPSAVQCMSGYCLQPRDAIYLSKLALVQKAVLTPTGGGRWTTAVPNSEPQTATIDCGMAASPLANDLLLAMAGAKMIVDNEMYLGDGQTRSSMRNRWWKSVIVGLDGAAWFSWSKRGWAWWGGRDKVLREAELFPYSNLIPFARRADAIHGVLDFAREMELVREYVLPKPWGPKARVGLVYSWANARWRSWEPQRPDFTGNYHAAMTYLHWCFDTLPEHLASDSRLSDYDLLVAGGIDHVEPELVKRLTTFVLRGGTLVVGGGMLDRDVYDKPLDSSQLLGIKPTGPEDRSATELASTSLPDVPTLPGKIVRAAGGTADRGRWQLPRARPRQPRSANRRATCSGQGQGHRSPRQLERLSPSQALGVGPSALRYAAGSGNHRRQDGPARTQRAGQQEGPSEASGIALAQRRSLPEAAPDPGDGPAGQLVGRRSSRKSSTDRPARREWPMDCRLARRNGDCLLSCWGRPRPVVADSGELGQDNPGAKHGRARADTIC